MIKSTMGKWLGIDSVITSTNSFFDTLLEHLQSLHYFKPERVEVISGNRIIEAIA